MATEKTKLEFQYSPPDFFEAPYRRETDEYAVVADAGLGCHPGRPIPWMRI
jgi:hypothetical protein